MEAITLLKRICPQLGYFSRVISKGRRFDIRSKNILKVGGDSFYFQNRSIHFFAKYVIIIIAWIFKKSI